MQKIIIICAYYGRLPDYFKTWALLVEANPSVDFLLVTDLVMPVRIPDNLKILNCSFENLRAFIQGKFEFEIKLASPYKLCDYRPAYGHIFEEYIEGYDFWGNCDIDMVFGDIRKFITDEILQQNDLIGFLGHFTLYRNRESVRKLFMRGGALFDYKTVYSSKENYAFDEVTGIMQIVLQNHVKHYYAPNYIDFDVPTIHYERMSEYHKSVKNYDNQVFYWEKGKIFQAYIEDDEVKTKEFMYLHFQKRNPLLEEKAYEAICGTKSFYIFNDRMEEKECGLPDKEYIVEMSHRFGTEFQKIQKLKYYKEKIARYWKLPKKQRFIWRKQRKKRLFMLWPDWQ